MQVKSGDQIEEKGMAHDSVEVNGVSVECVRDRVAEDDLLIGNSAATVISNHHVSPKHTLSGQASPTFIRQFGSFGGENRDNIYIDNKEPNSRVPTASFNRGNESNKGPDRRFAVSVPARLRIPEVGKYSDLYSPFGLES